MHPLFNRAFTFVPILLFCLCSVAKGQEWQRVGVDYHATEIADDGRIIFVGDYGGILLSKDNGTTWSLPVSGTWSHLRAVRFRDALNGLIAGDNGTLLGTSDGGETWTRLASPVHSSIHALDFPVATVGYALADSNMMLRTSDGGMTWDTLQSRLPGTGTGVQFINEERGILVTAEGIIYRTESSGKFWQGVYTDTALTFSGVAFDRNGINGYACAREGAVLRTTNAGVSWRMVTRLEAGLIPLCVALGDNGAVYVGGERVLAAEPDPFTAMDWSSNGGETWQRPRLLITGWSNLALHGIAVRGGRLSFAGNCGIALLSGLSLDFSAQQPVSNSLLTNRVPGGYNLPAYRVAFSGSDTGIATVNVGLGASNTIFLRTTDGGISWRYATNAAIQNYLDIFGFPQGEFLVFSSNRGGLDRTTNVGKTWLPQNTAPIVPKVLNFRGGTFLDRQHGYMTGDSLVYQTIDSGKTWQPRFFSGVSGTWSDLSVVTAISFPTFNDGYAVFTTGEGKRVIVIKTNDAGETWREVLSRQSQNSAPGLWFTDGEQGFYSEGRPLEKRGVLFSTTNGGETWDSLTFENAVPLAVKFFDENNGFVLGSPFLLMRTSDGGKTWNREYPWPPEVDTTNGAFMDAVLMPDERTVVLIGMGVIARKTYPDKLLSIGAEQRRQNNGGTLTVLPNPACDRLRVMADSAPKGSSVRLFDLLGRDVLGYAVPIGPSERVEIDVSGLPAGIYRALIQGREGEVCAVRPVLIVR